MGALDTNLVPFEMKVNEMQPGQWGYVVPWIFDDQVSSHELQYFSVLPESKGTCTAKLEKTETGFKKRMDW